jgi:hypothetical protein
MDLAADTLLIEQNERLVAEFCAGGNEAERLVERRDAGIGTGLGQLAQLFLHVLLECHGDKELLKALFELREVLGAVGAVKMVPVVEGQAQPSAVRCVLRVVLAVLSHIKVADKLLAKLSGVLDKVQGKDVDIVLAPWAKRGKVLRDGVEPPDVLLGLALAGKLDRL